MYLFFPFTTGIISTFRRNRETFFRVAGSFLVIAKINFIDFATYN